MTDEAIEIVEMITTQRRVDPRTRMTIEREIVDGYLLKRGNLYSGVHCSWSKRREHLCLFRSREHAQQGIEVIKQLADEERTP